MESKPYDMTKPGEVDRWFNEMEGYLKTQNFLNEGTDRQGRKYAMGGFYKLKEWFKKPCLVG